MRVFSPFGAFRLDVGYNGRAAPTGPAYVERLSRNEGLVATNGMLHDDVLEAIQHA